MAIKILLTQHTRCVTGWEVTLPDFQTDGLLPPGIHWASWPEIEGRFGGNSHRRMLLAGMELGLRELAACGCLEAFIDGSFVTAKEYPDDFDVCWDAAGVDLARLRQSEPALLTFGNFRALQKAKFFGEFFPSSNKAEARSPFRTFLDFFQSDKATGVPKGIVGLRTKNQP